MMSAETLGYHGRVPGPDQTTIAAPRRLGVYEIQTRLGAGGMGEVFRAIDTRLNRAVAIKICHEPFSERFEREALALSAVTHPHICTLFDIGPNYLVMELVQGVTLAERLQQGPLALDDIVRYGGQIADALVDAHAAGIVHRDLKPANIMLTKHGVKVLDFGLAKMDSADAPSLTATRAVMGTPAYMAPEQMAGLEADARTDLFALGLVLERMALGDATEARRQLPVPLQALIAQLLERDPARRPQSAVEVRDRLRAVQAPHGAGRAKALAGVAAAVIALGIGGGLWWMVRPTTLASRIGPLAGTLPVTSFPGDEEDPALSPDGARVAFSWTGAEGRNRDLYVLQIGEQTPLRLTSEASDERFPAWSPDGSRLAFVRQLDGDSAELRVIPALGGPARTLHAFRFDGRLQSSRLTWTPNGQAIVFTGYTDGTIASSAPTLQVLWLESGRVQQIFTDRVNTFGDFGAVISPDGRWLAFTPVLGAFGLFRVAVDNGIVEPLFEGQFPVVTLDGSRIIYAGRQPGLFMRSLQGDVSNNAEERLVDDYVLPVGGFVPVRGGVIYTGMTPDGKPRAFRFVDVSSRQARDIAPLPPLLGLGLTVSPDRRQLLYSANAADSSVDLLQLNFEKAEAP